MLGRGGLIVGAMTRTEPTTEALAARELAAEVGGELLALRAGFGGDPETLRDAGDREAHRQLMQRLSTRFPSDAVRSEEAADQPGRADADRVWIIDPLDGTREYAEGRDDWAVHVAFWAEGVLLEGAVALPSLGHTLSTADPPAPPAPGQRPSRLLVSRTRPSALAETLRAALDGELVAMGSAGAKIAAIIRGEADVYAHSGGQYEWDSAAPVAVAAAVGLHCSRLDGAPLAYNRPDPWLPDLLVCRPELAETVLATVRSAA